MKAMHQKKLDLRKRIADAHKAVKWYTKLSKRFKVSKSRVKRYYQEVQRDPHITEQDWQR